ncbi:MAG: VIT1/CCC1 transporter family protein [Anaerolineaceae bacterium]|nr:VIT1/CCC1 transporter family protein [Anaerolineaceae bacterium]
MKDAELPKNPIHRWFEQAEQYNGIANVGEIARRYFAMNAFDGILTIMGVLMGNLSAGVANPNIVITTGLSTCIAMGISGLWGSYLTESAERKHNLDELSQSTLTNLNDSRIGRASRYAAVVVSLVDGISPFLAALLVLIPFFLNRFFIDIQFAYYTSLGVALITLFGLGIFLGKISKENLLISGIKTVIAGIASIIIGSLLNGSAH